MNRGLAMFSTREVANLSMAIGAVFLAIVFTMYLQTSAIDPVRLTIGIAGVVGGAILRVGGVTVR